MRYKYVHILAAAFLIIGMGVQAVASYRSAARHVRDKINLQMELAQEKLRFQLYDAYDVAVLLENFMEDEMVRPEDLLEETNDVLRHYPQLFSCYVAFPEYRYPKKGKWCCMSSYRSADSILATPFGDARHDYFLREWYTGALANTKSGYWTQPYRDEDIDEPIFTFSNAVRTEDDSLVCIIGVDFSVAWARHLLEQYKPFDEAVFVLYSSDGEPLAVSGERTDVNFGKKWLVSRKTLSPIDIDFEMAVPRSYVWAGIRWGIWLPFVVFLLGIIVVGVLLRRLWHDQEERSKLELMQRDMQIAHDIQMSILPKEEFRDESVELRGTLLPMREVGGDLYDYYREEEYLWFIIGDVSGKGVPAAMFMSATVNLFRAAGRHSHSPKELTEEMNAVLSAHNPSLTFVTAFIGRLHVPSGELLYCNAGHCAPLIAATTVKHLDCNPNIPLGYDGHYAFVEQGWMLGEGEMLVLYTDGVTEARDAQRQMLGKERWTEMVAQGGDLLKSVKAFIGNAEPTDDITLMTICKQTAVQPLKMRVLTSEDQWLALRRAVHEYGICVGMDRRTLKKIEVATEEAVVNIVRYSGAKEIEMTISHQSSAICIQLCDDGKAFDPTAYTSRTDAVEARQIGGLGISLIRQIADELRYERRGDKNILTLVILLNR